MRRLDPELEARARSEAEMERQFFRGMKPATNRVMCPLCKGVYGVDSHLEGVTFTQHVADHLAAHIKISR